MAIYQVMFCVTYHIEAEEEGDAIDKGYDMARDEWGAAFVEQAGGNVELMEDDDA